MRIQTEANAIWTSRLKHERNDREKGEHDARNDYVHDVVSRFALQNYSECYTSEWRFIAVVLHLSVFNWNAYEPHKHLRIQYMKTVRLSSYFEVARVMEGYKSLKGTLRRRLSYGYFSFIAKYASNWLMSHRSHPQIFTFKGAGPIF